MLIVTMPNGTRFKMVQKQQNKDGSLRDVPLNVPKLVRAIHNARRIDSKLVYRNGSGMFIELQPKHSDE